MHQAIRRTLILPPVGCPSQSGPVYQEVFHMSKGLELIQFT